MPVDADALAETAWMRAVRRHQAPKSHLETGVLLDVAAGFGCAAFDMPWIGATYGPAVKRTFTRLVHAGVIHYTPRQPLRPGLVISGA